MAQVQAIEAANRNRSPAPGTQFALWLQSRTDGLCARRGRDSGLACRGGEWRGEKESMTECHGRWGSEEAASSSRKHASIRTCVDGPESTGLGAWVLPVECRAMSQTSSPPRQPLGGNLRCAATLGSPRVAVLISGRGTNLRALVGAFRASDLPMPSVRVISNEPAAPGLGWAASEGLATQVLCHRDFSHRQAFDQALLADVLAFEPDLVVLAGFMRILSPGFCEALAGRLINIHPSLLPAFAGLDTHRRALAAGVRLHGATVHAVTAELDHGPILAQAIVPVLPDDSAETLSARVLESEHQLYPLSVNAILAGVVRWEGQRWRILKPDLFRPLLLHPLLGMARSVTSLGT